jgi:hypothetical protein
LFKDHFDFSFPGPICIAAAFFSRAGRLPPQGEARGGLVEVTRKKEAELRKREEELARRWGVV